MCDEKIVAIYGAGRYGQKLYQMLNVVGNGIDYFVQSEIQSESSIEGVPVVSFEELMSFNKKAIVILFAQKRKTALINAKKYIKENKIKNISIFDCTSFIYENFGVINTNEFNKGNYICTVCNNDVIEFLPYGKNDELYEKHHIIGGGYRFNCDCPVCGSGDRERWFAYLLNDKLNYESMQGRVLHFAPEANLDLILRGNDRVDYYSVDIVPGKADHVSDITNIQFVDKFFDYIICNHVLEHIPNIVCAVEELKRVLKDDGKIIFSFPICTDMPTLDDAEITSEEDRLKYYGQEDHVRLYGIDYEEIYESYGLELEIYSPKDMLSKEEIEQYGFIEDDIIIVGKKCL